MAISPSRIIPTPNPTSRSVYFTSCNDLLANSKYILPVFANNELKILEINPCIELKITRLKIETRKQFPFFENSLSVNYSQAFKINYFL